MTILRVLTFPIAAATFLTLYSAAIKAPAAVELVSLALWIALPVVLVCKLVLKILTPTQKET